MGEWASGLVGGWVGVLVGGLVSKHMLGNAQTEWPHTHKYISLPSIKRL